MTDLQFRSSTERVGRMRQLLNDPTLAQAIVCVKESESPDDVPDGSDSVASVRWLSRKAGWHSAINMLLSLAEPLPIEPQEEEATFGVDKSQFAKASQSILR